MSEWQPIETAPKDGSHVLLWCEHMEGIRYVVAKYITPSGRDHGWGPFCWGADGEREIAERVPTHWMPLPSPPKAEDGK